jgi:hypothetical protein
MQRSLQANVIDYVIACCSLFVYFICLAGFMDISVLNDTVYIKCVYTFIISSSLNSHPWYVNAFSSYHSMDPLPSTKLLKEDTKQLFVFYKTKKSKYTQKRLIDK